MLVWKDLIIEGPSFEEDISYQFFEKDESKNLYKLEKGISILNFGKKISKRKIGLELKVFFINSFTDATFSSG